MKIWMKLAFGVSVLFNLSFVFFLVMEPGPEQYEQIVETHAEPTPQEGQEQLEADRKNFFIENLGLSPNMVYEYQRLRAEHFARTAGLWKTDPYGEVSFEVKRKLLGLEERLYRDVRKLLGEKNWERYQEFREAYNKEGFSRQVEENQPFLFMGL